MKITGFYIDGFGIFSDCRIDGLSSGLNIFTGSNEAGKSTLLAFFRQILLGLPTAKQKGERQYPPLRGGREGGILFIKTGSKQEVRLERRKGPRGGRVILTAADGSALNGIDVSSLTGGMSIELYRNIFAFSLNELQTIDSLDSSEVRSVIYSAGMGTGLQKLPEAEKFIAARQQELFRPRSRKMAINALLSRLDAVNRELKEAEAENLGYEKLCHRLESIEEQAAQCREKLEKKRLEKARLECLQNLREVWLRFNLAQEKIKGLGRVPEDMPADGLIKLESIETRLEEAASRYEESHDALMEKKEEMDAMQPDASLIGVRSDVSGLMEALPLYQQAVERLPGLESDARAHEQEIKTMCGALGRGWDMERVKKIDRSMFTRDAITEYRQRLATASDNVRSARQTYSERSELLHQAELHAKKARDEMERLEQETEPYNSAMLEQDYQQALSAHKNMVSMGSRLENMEQELSRGISRISPAWTLEHLKEFDLSASARSWIRDQEQEHKRISLELERLRDRDSQAKSRLDQAKKTAASRRQELRELAYRLVSFAREHQVPGIYSHSDDYVPKAPDTSRVWNMARALESTAARFSHLEEKNRELQEKCTQASNAIQEHKRQDPGLVPISLLPARFLVSLSALFIIAAPLAWYWLGQHGSEYSDQIFASLSLLMLSFCSFGTGIFIYRKNIRKRNRDEETFLLQHKKLEQEYRRLESEAAVLRQEIEEIIQQAVDILAGLGMSREQVSDAVISPDSLSATSENFSSIAEKFQEISNQMNTVRIRLEEAEDKGKSCLSELEGISSQIGKYRDEMTRLDSQWKDFLEKNALDSTTAPSDMNVILGIIESCRRDLSEHERLIREISDMKQHVLRFLRHIQEISGISGLEEGPLPASLEKAWQFIEKQQGRARDLELAAQRVQTVEDAAKKAHEALASAQKQTRQAETELKEVTEQWEEWLQSNGFAQSFSPDTLLDALGIMERILEKQDSLDRIQSGISQYSAEIKEFKKRVADIFTRLGRQVPDDSNVISAVRQLDDETEKHLSLKAARKEIQKDITRLEKAGQRLKERLDRLQQEHNELLQKAGARDAEDFRKLHDTFMQHEALCREMSSLEDSMKKIAAGHKVETMLSDLETSSAEEISVAIESLNDDIAELQEQKDALSEKTGELKDRVSRLADSAELSMLRENQERIKAEIEELCRRWSVYAVAAHLISSVRNYFESERQPEVITRAGEFFRAITHDRYSGIISPPGSSEILAVTEDGDRVPPESLSRGTAEQLYLALRFGYVTSRQGAEPMPLLMDDILVNFDPGRAQAAAETIINLAKEMQIIFLTCHPETAEMFRNAAGSVQHHNDALKYFEVSRGNISMT